MSVGRFCMLCSRSLFELSKVLDGANHLAGVRVLVVVPSHNLNERVAVANLANHGLVGVEERTELHADDVAADELLLGVAERLVLGSLHGGVDALNSHLTLDNSVQDGGRTCGSGNALGSADELTVQLMEWRSMLLY